MKWQPIETAPKDGTHILVWQGNNYGYKTEDVPFGVATYGRGSFDMYHWYSVACCDGVSYFEPTHWMPLPEPPTND